MKIGSCLVLHMQEIQHLSKVPGAGIQPPIFTFSVNEKE